MSHHQDAYIIKCFDNVIKKIWFSLCELQVLHILLLYYY